MMLEELIDRCAETAKAKGFCLSQHATQVCLVATEVAEALDYVTQATPLETRIFITELRRISVEFEGFRQSAESYGDFSEVVNREKLMVELADVCIRVFSYVGGNGWRDYFVGALLGKMAVNRHRSLLHGKAF